MKKPDWNPPIVKLGCIVIGICLLMYFLMCMFMTSCCYYPEDNYLEEEAEDIIEHYTGKQIDLSPFTEEKPKVQVLDVRY